LASRGIFCFARIVKWRLTKGYRSVYNHGGRKTTWCFAPRGCLYGSEVMQMSDFEILYLMLTVLLLIVAVAALFKK
ncbi:MAG: hypothetical protein RSD95_10465, partial [Clostridia bacterium]